MGLLIDGKWHDQWYDTSKNGSFKREESQFRHIVGSDSKFAAEKDRYHLYVSLACPWAHRTLIFRKLKELEDIISLSIVNPHMGENGWSFEPFAGVIADPFINAKYLYEIYLATDSKYRGRVTVPILWDKKYNRIVNNESSEIIRIFNSAFNKLTGNTKDFYPKESRNKIDEINQHVYDNINNGVYKAGFATSQESYKRAVTKLFKALDNVENILSQSKYLVGDNITEADWRLFTTLVRFDTVYVGHFKANIKCLREYPNLWNYTRDLFQQPGIASTVNFDHIKHHYYTSHKTINPTGIVPEGPLLDFMQPHNRK